MECGGVEDVSSTLPWDAFLVFALLRFRCIFYLGRSCLCLQSRCGCMCCFVSFLVSSFEYVM